VEHGCSKPSLNNKKDRQFIIIEHHLLSMNAILNWMFQYNQRVTIWCLDGYSYFAELKGSILTKQEF